MSEITIYLKLTNGCQLRCKHCYNANTNFSGDISNDVLLQSIDFINEKAKTNKVNLILHGGEPLLNGLEKPLIAVNKTPDVAHFVTTNLMYELSQEHIYLFKKMHLVSTSWDYKIRFITSNQEKLWRKNVSKLLEENINVAPIITLSKYIIEDLKPSSLINMFKSIDVKQINFERLTETGNAKENSLKANNKDIDNWLLDAYKSYEGSGIRIPLFESVEQSVNNNILIGCRKRECQSHVITINTDGSISGCPNCYDCTYGNVDGKFDTNKYNALNAKESIRDNRCYLCEHYKVCNGDCCQLSWDNTGCPGMPSIFNYLLNKKQS